MKKIFILAAIQCSLLAACSSTPESTSKINLSQQLKMTQNKSVLIYESGEYKIKQTLQSGYRKYNAFNISNGWVINNNLFPLGITTRFECEVKSGKCDQYENHDSPFVKVSGLQSDYGDTFSERLEEIKKEDGKNNLNEAVTKTVLAVYAGPVIIAAGATLGPIFAGINLAKTGSVWRNKWVEFDHDSFNQEASNAIIKQYGSIDNHSLFLQEMDSVYSKAQAIRLEQIDSYSEIQFKYTSELKKLAEPFALDDYSTQLFKFEKLSMSMPELPSSGTKVAILSFVKQQINEQYKANLSMLDNDYKAKRTSIISVRQKLNNNYIAAQKRRYKNSHSSEQLKGFIKKYSNKDLAGLITQAKNKYNQVFIKEEENTFEKVISISDMTAFIKKYKNEDLAKLVTRAEISRNESIQAHKDKVLVKLQAWRKTLKVGDKTFCGYIVDKNDAMIKIALNAKLAGYANEEWVHLDDTFEVNSSCINRNGHVSPRYNPLKISFQSELKILGRVKK
jgi:hypothetical protein